MSLRRAVSRIGAAFVGYLRLAQPLKYYGRIPFCDARIFPKVSIPLWGIGLNLGSGFFIRHADGAGPRLTRGRLRLRLICNANDIGPCLKLAIVGELR